jgi:hypothetical protein
MMRAGPPARNARDTLAGPSTGATRIIDDHAALGRGQLYSFSLSPP